VIPKGTFVFPNLYGIMHDSEHFKDPERFDPERFIVRNKETGGITFTPNQRVIPFSIGKRSCLGQTLAEKEFFLFFSGIMQHFAIHPDPKQILPNYDIKSTHPKGPNRPAPSHKVILKSRIM
jgi:cytochrome P450